MRIWREVGETRIQNRLVSSKGVVLAVVVVGSAIAMMERWEDVKKSLVRGRKVCRGMEGFVKMVEVGSKNLDIEVSISYAIVLLSSILFAI